MLRDPPAHLPTPNPDARAFRRPSSKSQVAYYSWRVRMWVEGTFALTVMEPWEKLVVVFAFLVMSILVSVSLIRFLPAKITTIQRQTAYYLWGHHDGIDSISSSRTTLSNWTVH
ncbi:hypothetical protein Moror_656 [Moniliophthora roreri MCA 2997]|uniref:Uncharacterized protein n=1 Tax=Moniliophthora roreri (strain MCA 2997) TaxID=1381753 RepID=V2WWW9_MONRO|nr:hypothetical protein Moror_656 [Moniliophthora roreri MCA 2997]